MELSLVEALGGMVPGLTPKDEEAYLFAPFHFELL